MTKVTISRRLDNIIIEAVFERVTIDFVRTVKVDEYTAYREVPMDPETGATTEELDEKYIEKLWASEGPEMEDEAKEELGIEE